jgi:hypothetical protein
VFFIFHVSDKEQSQNFGKNQQSISESISFKLNQTFRFRCKQSSAFGIKQANLNYLGGK